ncbi:hypothetical protein ABPG75_012690 [Micractinium tetrahymenae]
MSDRGAPAAAARLDDLPCDVLDLIAAEWIHTCSPLWDRHDVLQLAAALSIAGGAACRHLAGALFAFLSPRLGRELPVDERSSQAALEVACKEVGLPVSGTKQALLARLREQVEDSAHDAEEQPPKHCLVSAHTRAELAGWRQQRISQSKAGTSIRQRELSQEVFEPPKSALSELPFQWQWWEERVGARRAALQAGLLERGHAVAKAESMVQGPSSFVWVWGNKQGEPVAAACDSLERHAFVFDQAAEHYHAAVQADTWQPPRRMSQYKAQYTRRDCGMDGALPRWVATQPSLEAIRANPAVPRSLLPRLEGLWAQHQRQQNQQQAGPSS